MTRMQFSILAAIIAGMLGWSTAPAQTPTALPTYAQEHFAKGLDAAQRQAWDKAFENFYQALAPWRDPAFNNTPEYAYAPMYFNLGVVFEKVGAQLEAAACLQAYLELAPNASNRAAVQQEIASLTKVRSAQIDLIFQRATDAFQKLENGSTKSEGYGRIALDYAAAGKIGRAIDLVKLISNNRVLARVPDLFAPGPWVQYAATLASADSGECCSIGLEHRFRSSGYPDAARKILDHLDRTFPILPRAANPNDTVVGMVDREFQNRSRNVSNVRTDIGKTLSELSTGAAEQRGGLSETRQKVVAFAKELIQRAHSSDKTIKRSAFDLESNIKSALDPNAPFSHFPNQRNYGGSEYATAVILAKVAGEFGAELFRFELLQRGTTAEAYALQRPEVEEALWNSIKDAKTSDRFQGYLAWFPKGRFAELAMLKIKTIDAESKLASMPATVSVEEALRKAKEAAKVDNFPEQMKWLRTAADQGNADAQYAVAYMYQLGQGVPADGAEALRWYRKAADQGDAAAMVGIGHFYEKGAQGILKDLAEAERWYRKAADQGNALALGSLAELYEYSYQNYTEAMKWYRKGADKGLIFYQLAIGRFYEKGLGVNRDIRQAIYWYTLAANNEEDFLGFRRDAAKEALKRLGQVRP